jgi:hypothetical protein
MKRSPLLAFALFLLITPPFSGCLNNDTDCDPTMYCDPIQPTSGSIYISLTNNAENPSVPLAVYLGNASDSSLYFRDTVFGGSTSYFLPIEERYSFVIKYRQRGATVYAVDGGKITYSSTTNCNETCYTTKDLTLNMKLLD